MLQVIHASVGVWFPTIQFVVHFYNPKTKERIWSSTNVSGFSTDGRSCKASEFSIVHNPPTSADFDLAAGVYTRLLYSQQPSID
ncbi:hypothetical protein EXIGLDRAFT_733547 [Exidia glandulosa HHB12029]|uniref:Svf1-like N-terminal domain-containing protein n=1 Tax=Exidia glandulosa HHB12029 TaxID=1314781 RepID=A0A165BA09_EXIGL|nr:hypothetical protein EXIGLDRAFT_733547 [Exidia glandulosa HHB12029]